MKGPRKDTWDQGVVWSEGVDSRGSNPLAPPVGSVQRVERRSNERVSRCRVALYSHDTMGLGHMRRNLSIAEVLASCEPRPVILLIAGSREVGAFSLPSGVDSLALPALYKDGDSCYRSRSLDISLDEIRLIRQKIVHAALDTFAPDILIVDKVPTGAVDELRPSLEFLRRRARTRCILGLRDILDDPMVVQNEWSLCRNYEAIRRYYDTIWVYGDPAVYDLVREYRFPTDIAAIARYTGYLAPFKNDSIGNGENDFWESIGLASGRLVLCMVGGGQDGARLAEAFIETDLPPDTTGVLLTGPFMPLDRQQQLCSRASAQSDLRVISFIPNPIPLLKRAECIITMGGYNTICEALSLEKQVLVVPRDSPRREQLIRAERMRDLGLLDMLRPDEVTPRALRQWLYHRKESLTATREKVDLNGLKRLPGMLSELLRAAPRVNHRLGHSAVAVTSRKVTQKGSLSKCKIGKKPV